MGFLLDTTGEAIAALDGTIHELHRLSGDAPIRYPTSESGIMDRVDKPTVPYFICLGLNTVDWKRKYNARRFGV